MVTWSQSGKGYIPLDINSVQKLAIASGFVFEGEHDLAKVANLGAFFQYFGVTSLSAFKKLFYTCRLTENGREDTQETSKWVQQCLEGEHFVGETSDLAEGGLRHGLGRLQYQVGTGSAVYLGQFKNGAKEGFGVLIASSGHRYEGQFQDDVMCGHGVFLYPSSTAQSERPARFEGSFNGKPNGKGIYTLCNGRQEHGIYNGTTKTGDADMLACTSAAALARRHAEAAQRVQRQVESELKRHSKTTLLIEAPKLV